MIKPITVLLADDNPHIHDSFQMLIGTLDDITIASKARNGVEAIAKAEELQPDVILMDMNMSPINGFEATRQILEANPDIKIIGLSLHSDITYCKNMLRIGAKGYLTKASTYREIIDAIKEVAAGGRYIDRNILSVI